MCRRFIPIWLACLVSPVFLILASCATDSDSSLERVKHDGVIVFAMGRDFPPFYYRNEEIAIAFRKEDQSLRRAVNRVIEDMGQDDTLNRLIRKVAGQQYELKWLVSLSAPPSPTPVQ